MCLVIDTFENKLAFSAVEGIVVPESMLLEIFVNTKGIVLNLIYLRKAQLSILARILFIKKPTYVVIKQLYVHYMTKHSL
jgi:hypothetical protein